MSEYPHPDTPSVYHNGSDAVRRNAYAAQPGAEPATGADGAPAVSDDAGTAAAADRTELAPPVRFALYADSEATEDIPDEELPTSDGFDPASVLMWGLEDAEEACAYRCDRGTGHREQFICNSAADLCELLELAGYGPLRVLYL